MIVYACLARLSDGTPLSATTDFASDADGKVQEGKRCVKLLSKQLSKYGRRVCVQGAQVTVQCVVDECTAYMVVCEPNYPHILAFSFLNELMKEFNVLYTSSVVKSVRRPYAFIEFDSFLQKTRQKYSNSRALATRLNLAEMTTDLNLHPPTYVRMQQLDPPAPPPPTTLSVTAPGLLSSSHSPSALSMPNGVLPNGAAGKDVSTVGVALKLKPISWYGWLALLLCLPCLLLDLYRGLIAVNSSSFEDPDSSSPWHGLSFLSEAVVLATQGHMLWRYNKFRKLGTLCCWVVVVTLCCLLLDVRDLWLSLLYALLSSSLLLATFRRPFQRKLPRFHV